MRLCHCSSIFFRAALALFPLAMNAASWSSISVVSQSIYTSQAQEAVVALNNNGQIVAGWKGYDPTNSSPLQMNAKFGTFTTSSLNWGNPLTWQGTDINTNNVISIGIDSLSNSIAAYTAPNPFPPRAMTAPLGGTFGTAANLATNGNVQSTICAMNPSGIGGIVGWADTAGGVHTIAARLFDGSNFGTQINLFPQTATNVGFNTLATGGLLSMSPIAGNIVFGWSLGTAPNTIVQAAFMINGVALPVQSITGTGNFSAPSIAVNDLGQAMMAWTDNTNAVVLASFYNGTTWSTPFPSLQTGIVTGVQNTTRVVIDANGNAIVGWLQNNGLNNIYQISIYTLATNSWSAPINISAPGKDASEMYLVVNPSGQAVTTWMWGPQNNFPQLQAATIFNGSVTSYPILQTGNASAVSLANGTIAIGLNGFAVAIWRHADSIANTTLIETSFINLPSPSTTPQNLTGTAKSKNNFGTIYEIVKTLTFQPPIAGTVNYYNVYANQVLIGTVPGTGPFVFNAHDSTKAAQLFSVTAVNSSGESLPATTSF